MAQEKEVTAPKKSRIRRLIKLAIKISVTILCFWFISTKIDFTETFRALAKANWWWLLASVLIYVASKIVAAFRLNIYFKNIRLHLPASDNLRLYWLGMFYNLFLPGSISGDAYKVIILNKKMSAPYKKTSSAVLLDRFSGLLGLGILLCIYGILALKSHYWNLLLVLGFIGATATFYFLVRLFFKDFVTGFFPTFFFGILVQAIQVGGVYLILKALGIETSHQEWIFIFLVASVVSVLPLSLGGGLGTREVVFAEGARFFDLDPHVGVIISLLFYLTSVAGAVWGAYFIFHDPLKKDSRQ